MVLSFHVSNLGWLELVAPSKRHKNDCAYMEHAVMYGGTGASAGRGLKAQADAMGYTARFIPVDDSGSLYHGRAFRPKVLAGKVDAFHTEGATFRVELSPKEKTSEPPPFFLDGDVAWPEEGTVKKENGEVTFSTVAWAVTSVVSYSDAMKVMRVSGAQGEPLCAVCAVKTEGLSLRPGLTARAEPGPPRGGRRRAVDSAQKLRCKLAVRDAVARTCPLYATACSRFALSLAKHLSRRKGPELSAVAMGACADLESALCWRSVCTGEGGCGETHHPCSLAAVLRAKAEQESLAAAAGDALVVAARQFRPGGRRDTGAGVGGAGGARQAARPEAGRAAPRAAASAGGAGRGRSGGGARGREQSGSVRGRGGDGGRAFVIDGEGDAVMRDGGVAGGGGDAAVDAADAQAVHRSLLTRMKQRLRALAVEGFCHLSWLEAAEVCKMLFHLVQGKPVVSSCANAEFMQHVEEAAVVLRQTESGARHEADNLEAGEFVLVVRPLAMGEVSRDKKRARRNSFGASESEAEEVPAEMARDTEWDAVMRHLAEIMHPSISQGITLSDVEEAVKGAYGANVPSPIARAPTVKRVMSSLKALACEGLATRQEVGGGAGDRFVLKAAAYGDCPSGPLRGDVPGMAAFDQADADLD